MMAVRASLEDVTVVSDGSGLTAQLVMDTPSRASLAPMIGAVARSFAASALKKGGDERSRDTSLESRHTWSMCLARTGDFLGASGLCTPLSDGWSSSSAATKASRTCAVGLVALLASINEYIEADVSASFDKSGLSGPSQGSGDWRLDAMSLEPG